MGGCIGCLVSSRQEERDPRFRECDDNGSSRSSPRTVSSKALPLPHRNPRHTHTHTHTHTPYRSPKLTLKLHSRTYYHTPILAHVHTDMQNTHILTHTHLERHGKY